MFLFIVSRTNSLRWEIYGAEMHIAVSVISWTKMEIGKCYGICGPNCKVDIESEKSGLKFRNNYVVVSGSLLAGHVIRLDPSLLENCTGFELDRNAPERRSGFF